MSGPNEAQSPREEPADPSKAGETGAAQGEAAEARGAESEAADAGEIESPEGGGGAEPAKPPAPPETTPYSTSGLLIASLSLVISIWAARSMLPVRIITTLTITLLPLAGMALAVGAILRRPRVWPAASGLIALHGATLAFAIHAYLTLAR